MGASALVIPILEPRSGLINVSNQTTLYYNMKFIEKINLLLISGVSLLLVSCDGGSGESAEELDQATNDERAEALDVGDLFVDDSFVYTTTSGDLDFSVIQDTEDVEDVDDAEDGESNQDVKLGFSKFDSTGATPESNGRFFQYQKTDTYKFEIRRVGSGATAKEQLPIILEILLNESPEISTRFRALIQEGPDFTDDELNEIVDIYNAGGAEIFRGDNGKFQAVNDIVLRHEVTSSLGEQRSGGIMSGLFRLDTTTLGIIARKITNAESDFGRFVDPDSWVLDTDDAGLFEYKNSGVFVINLANKDPESESDPLDPFDQ